MQLDVVFELARLSDRPADADGLMRLVRHQLEYLASGVRAAAYAASEGGNRLQRLHLTAHLSDAKCYNTSSTK